MATPLVIHDRNVMRELILSSRTMGRRIGFIPTMGSLHAGHTSLVDQAVAECNDVVTSIFVNPSQFGPQEDFEQYPRDFDADFNLLARHDVRWIFAPDVHEMYPPGDSTRIEIGGPAEPYEGTLRPGHFSGVATIVFRLLQAAPSHAVYFGAKDWQQVLVVRKMVHDLKLDVEVMTCPTVRDTDGLALSSRNTYLSESERNRAQTIYAALEQAAQNWCRGLAIDTIEQKVRDMLSAKEIQIDYADIVHTESLKKISEVSQNTPAIFLIACRVGSTRLIDNILLPSQALSSC
jgi:pantoate--beta-alanine ligase